MATNITYNGKSLPHPLPLVSRDENVIRYGEKWGTQYRYTLEGFLVNCTGYDALIDEQQQILNIFNKDFQELSITDTDVSITHPVCFIEGISFGDSDYLYNVPYTVNISEYQSGFFEQNGILEPQDNWEFQETEDQKVNLNHTVAARGFNTSTTATNALRNAINFVQQRTGLTNEPSTQFITGAGDFILSSQAETLNRLNGEYSITETYEKDQTTAGMVKRYQVAINSGLQGFIGVNIEGSIEGGINADLENVRSEYHGFDIFGVASGSYTGATLNNDLNINPISSGVTENPYDKVINFNVSYDNNPDALISLDYNLDVQEGENFTVVNIDGNVIGRGDLTNKWSEVQNYYYQNVDPYNLASAGYSWYGGTYAINSKPVSSGVTYDSYAGMISFRVSYNDKVSPPRYFQTFDYAVSFKPSIKQVITSPLHASSPTWFPHGSGEHYLTDLGFYNKVEMNIDGTATLENLMPTETGIVLIEDEIDKIFFVYANSSSYRTKKEIASDPPFGQQITFSYAWVFDGPPVNSTDNYGLVLNLNTRI